MGTLKVASICPLMRPADTARNLQTLARWTQIAALAGADLVLFPEMFISGYATEEMYERGFANKDRFLATAEPIPGPSTEQLADLSRRLGVGLCAGLLERDGETLFNTQFIITPDRGLLGGYRKVQVAANLESWFSEPGQEFPVFDVGGIPTGIMICRDKSHPEIARILALEGALLILNPHSTTNATKTKMSFIDWSLRLCIARAMENGCYLIANNPIFNCPVEPDEQAGYAFAIDPYGRVIHCDFPPGDTEKMALITVDTEVVHERRAMEGEHFNLWSRTPSAYQRLVDPGPAQKRRK
jgi:predicted amidohydrolase